MSASVTPIHANRGTLPIDYEAVIVALEEDITVLTDRVRALEALVAPLTGPTHE